MPKRNLLHVLFMAMMGASLVAPGSVRAEPAQAMGARLGGDESGTRLVIDLSRPVEAQVFTLANPYRVVIDLPDVTFQMGTATPDMARGLVSAYRYGVIAPGRSRVVLDLTRPAAVDKPEIIPAFDDQPARLVIKLIPATREAFRNNLSMSAAALGAKPPLPTGALATPNDSRPLIVVDAGHGGIDTGARAPTGESEKDIVLSFAQSLRQKLEKSGRYRVLMTRDDDRFITLGERVEIGRQHTAALFLSIHADSISDPFGVRGATIYTLSDTASDADAARLAEKENRADVIAGVDLSEEPDEVAGILIDLTRRETMTFSGRFANNLAQSVRGAVKLNRNPLRSARFRVLRAHDVPSVLFELGYMSNRDDLKLLTSEVWRSQATDAMLKAVDGFFSTSGAITATGSVN